MVHHHRPSRYRNHVYRFRDDRRALGRRRRDDDPDRTPHARGGRLDRRYLQRAVYDPRSHDVDPVRDPRLVRDHELLHAAHVGCRRPRLPPPQPAWLLAASAGIDPNAWWTHDRTPREVPRPVPPDGYDRVSLCDQTARTRLVSLYAAIDTIAESADRFHVTGTPSERDLDHHRLDQLRDHRLHRKGRRRLVVGSERVHMGDGHDRGDRAVRVFDTRERPHHAAVGPELRNDVFHGGWRRTDPLATHLLVLGPSRSVHHCTAGLWDDESRSPEIFGADAVRPQIHHLFYLCDGRALLWGVGTPHVHDGYRPQNSGEFHGDFDGHRDPECDQGVQLA